MPSVIAGRTVSSCGVSVPSQNGGGLVFGFRDPQTSENMEIVLKVFLPVFV